jgi:hypothetical protein
VAFEILLSSWLFFGNRGDLLPRPSSGVEWGNSASENGSCRKLWLITARAGFFFAAQPEVCAATWLPFFSAGRKGCGALRPRLMTQCTGSSLRPEAALPVEKSITRARKGHQRRLWYQTGQHAEDIRPAVSGVSVNSR